MICARCQEFENRYLFDDGGIEKNQLSPQFCGLFFFGLLFPPRSFFLFRYQLLGIKTL